MQQFTTTQAILILAGHERRDPRTVERWRRGERVRRQTAEGLERSARALGLDRLIPRTDANKAA